MAVFGRSGRTAGAILRASSSVDLSDSVDTTMYVSSLARTTFLPITIG
ncbi:hypothetical protein JNB_00330 [Janibacter sp. HTCC2649]|nr:hypothetical protein JNB_00330 [Janibacter sp. HTCC2649]